MRFKIWKSKKQGYGYEPDLTLDSKEAAEQRVKELRQSGYYSAIWVEA